MLPKPNETGIINGELKLGLMLSFQTQLLSKKQEMIHPNKSWVVTSMAADLDFATVISTP